MFLDIVMGRKKQVRLILSPIAVAVLDELARQTESSRAEVIDAIAHAKVTLHTDTPEWSFCLIHEEDQTTVKPWSGSVHQGTDGEPDTHVEAISLRTTSTTTNNHPDEISTDHDDIKEIERLQHEKAELHSQLSEARSQIHHLQAKLTSQPSSLPTRPSPAVSTAPDISPSPAVSSAPAVSPDPASLAFSDATEQLQEQLTNLKAAYAQLDAAFQQQKVENSHLQQSLAQMRQFASIGEAQLNRWKYKTFSR